MQKFRIHVAENPEDNAMLQAMYSRSSESVDDHIEKVKQSGSGKFMEQYYVGYSHASIGDCGMTTMYFEGISMLAAKAIQDHSLYNGQESSTRYIDWTSQPFFNPYKPGESGFAETETAYQAMRKFYIESRPLIEAKLKQEHPMPEDGKQRVYDKAIAARAFDILRGFLPCGATTNVAWTTSLRNAHDHLTKLFFHPLEEVRDIAMHAYTTLWKVYPNSFRKDAASYEGRFNYNAPENEYLRRWDHFYATHMSVEGGRLLPKYDSEYVKMTLVSSGVPLSFQGSEHRPNKAMFPKHSTAAGSVVELNLVMDFGSFRDLQRHRNGYCSMPIVDPSGPIHAWYIDQLPEEVRGNIFEGPLPDLLEAISWKIEDKHKDLRFQYAQPMATIVPVKLGYTIPQLAYVGQLRAGATVHSTLRPWAQSVCKALNEVGIKVEYDETPDPWDLRRGEQDIVRKSDGEVR